MTLEEKAKAYDEALKIAKSKIKNDKDHVLYENDIIEIFPELKESEDEKIRKELTEFLKKASGGFLDSTIQCKTFGKWCAWIKKQDGQKSTADKVEPKFHVGDWIVQENIGVYKVIEICESWYEVVDSENNHYSISFDNEYMCRRWTIQDAKSGDVLYSLDSTYPFIFKHRKPYEQAEVYCGINIYEKFFVENTKDCIITTDKYIPATKEQRDFLFQKMNESGYKWDSDRKELKKIEPKFHVGDWVELNIDDEKMLNRLIGVLDGTNKEDYHEGWEYTFLPWLKSLRLQNKR